MSPTAPPRPPARRLRQSAAAVLRWGRGPLFGLALLALLFPPAHWFLAWLMTLPPTRAEAVALSAASIWICCWAAHRAAHARSASKPVREVEQDHRQNDGQQAWEVRPRLSDHEACSQNQQPQNVDGRPG